MNKFNLCIIFSFFVLATCEPYPTGPEFQTEILEIKIVPKEVFPLDTVFIKVRYRDSLDTRFNFTWNFDGGEKFITDTNFIYKKVPGNPGYYSGVVTLNNGEEGLEKPKATIRININENE